MLTFVVVAAVFFGSICRAMFGWLQSGQKFIFSKFAATMIFTFFVVALPIGTSLLASEIAPNMDVLIGLIIAAMIAGWGADSGLKVLVDANTADKKDDKKEIPSIKP